MSLPKHLQKQTSHYMLTYNLVGLCHNTSLENVHEPWFTCHKRGSRIKFHFSFSNALLLHTGRQNKNLQRFKDTFFPWIWRTAAHAAPDAWNSSAAQTHRQPPSLSHKLCLVQGKDHVALQRGKGGENVKFGGKRVGIGRLRFTFLSGMWYQDKVRPRLSHKTEQREEESYHCFFWNIEYDMIYVR